VSRTINLYRAEKMALSFLDKSTRLTMISSTKEPVFIWVSQSWLNYLGWSFEEMTQTPFVEFIHPDDVPSSMEVFKRFQQTGELGFNGTFKNRYKCKSGFYKTIVWEQVLQRDDSFYMMEARVDD